MIEKIYKEHMVANLSEIERLDFHDLLRYCRELMGVKQYACAEYLGFEHPRYKKLERGTFAEPIESWEMKRLVTFFKLPDGMLQKKQKQYLNRGPTNRVEAGKNIWKDNEETVGSRGTRSGGDYTREKGTLD